METVNDIHKWLRSGKDFKSGVKILELVDPTFPKLYLLRGADNSYSKSILEKRLNELADQMPEKPIKIPIRKSIPKSAPLDQSKRDYSKLPEDLQLKYSRSGQILSEANYIKGQLPGKPQNERPILIARIMDLFHERRIIWNQIDEFFDPKKPPQQKPKKATRGMAPEPDDIDLKIKRLKQNISKNRNRPDRKHEVLEWSRKLEYLRWEKQALKNAAKK